MLNAIPLNALGRSEVFDSSLQQKIVNRTGVDKSDLKKYKKIFKLLSEKNISGADEIMADIDNPILMGHVLAVKYLNTSYKSSPEELHDWLQHYSDLYETPRIAKILGRKTTPTEGFTQQDDTWLVNNTKISHKYLERLNRQDKLFLVKNAKEFRSHLRRGKTLAARRILENPRFKKLAPKPYLDQLGASLALKYLLDNNDTKALEWGNIASMRHDSGMATWVAGLAAWRLKKYKTAASYFARLGSSNNSDVWLVAAGAFWSARAYEKIGNTLKAQEMLKLAAKYKYTFYGILSAYQLGLPLHFDFEQNNYLSDFKSPQFIDDLMKSEAFKRAVLLIELKQPVIASKEIYNAYKDFTDQQKETIILMAHQKGLHSVVISLSHLANLDSLLIHHEQELYPLPDWSRQDDWGVEKPLVLALIRQESAFRDDAKSHSGAMGLMQLMPSTASYISGDKSIKRDKTKLYNPKYNLELGQKYVNYLLSKPFIEGNLFFMLTAYNAGPGNLAKWLKTARYQDDPLLFIEVIPSAETRIYIERVMANYWIYNLRLKQRNLTLEQVGANQWPVLEQYRQILFD